MRTKTPVHRQSSKLKDSVIDGCEKQRKWLRSIPVENKISHNDLSRRPTLEVTMQMKAHSINQVTRAFLYHSASEDLLVNKFNVQMNKANFFWFSPEAYRKENPNKSC